MAHISNAEFEAAAQVELNCPRCGERSSIAESQLRQLFAAAPAEAGNPPQDTRPWIDRDHRIAHLMALAANASGRLEAKDPELSAKLWAAIQALTLPVAPPAASKERT